MLMMKYRVGGWRGGDVEVIGMDLSEGEEGGEVMGQKMKEIVFDWEMDTKKKQKTKNKEKKKRRINHEL